MWTLLVCSLHYTLCSSPFTQNTFSPNWTSFTLPWAWISMPLDPFTIYQKHWSFSPNWTCFTLPWAWTLMTSSRHPRALVFFTKLVLLHPVLGNGLLPAFLHHIPEHWSFSPVGLASPCPGQWTLMMPSPGSCQISIPPSIPLHQRVSSTESWEQ